jgi:hypothetical protein
MARNSSLARLALAASCARASRRWRARTAPGRAARAPAACARAPELARGEGLDQVIVGSASMPSTTASSPPGREHDDRMDAQRGISSSGFARAQSPSTIGIITSVMIKSGLRSRTEARASAPFSTLVVWYRGEAGASGSRACRRCRPRSGCWLPAACPDPRPASLGLPGARSTARCCGGQPAQRLRHERRPPPRRGAPGRAVHLLRGQVVTAGGNRHAEAGAAVSSLSTWIWPPCRRTRS